MNKWGGGGTDNRDGSDSTDEHQWRHVAQELFDPEQEGGLTTTIVYAIAEAKGVSPMEVRSPPLYDVVDVAGIEATFFGSRNGNDRQQGMGTVEFRYTDYRITVRSDGWVQVDEPLGTDSP